MTRHWWMIGLVVLFLGVSCSTGPESAAQNAFEAWAKTKGVPYQNVQIGVVQNDGTFATIHILAEFRSAQELPWIQQETQFKCHKVGQDWQCDPIQDFSILLIPPDIASRIGGLGKIAYVSSHEGDGHNHIYITNPNLAGSRRLARITDCANDDGPSWSPDSRKVAFFCTGGEGGGIYVVNADGENLHRVTKDWQDNYPTWSPDGQWIAFGSGDGAIHIINDQGENPRKLTEANDFANPSWSPDGGTIAYSRKDGIYLMNTDGGGVRKLANQGTCPTWSPDGHWIAFTSIPPGVYVMDADGKNVRRLTDSDISTGCPTWSPDGKWIAFVPSGLNAYGAILLDANGQSMYKFIPDAEGQAIGSRMSWSR